jgi:hypothetical protein
MEVIGRQSTGQNPYAAKGLQPSHKHHKSFRLGGTVARALENEPTIDHPGNALVKTLTLSLDAPEPHECAADYTEQTIKVYLKNVTPSQYLTCPYSLLRIQASQDESLQRC